MPMHVLQHRRRIILRNEIIACFSLLLSYMQKYRSSMSGILPNTLICYLRVTVAPAASSFFFISSASAFGTFSRIGAGALSTIPLASARPN